MQRRIGLTSGIASGKSTVGALLLAHGWPLLDADQFAHEALTPGSPTSAAVLAHFGRDIQAAGEPARVNRAALGRIVFSDARERQWLEQLIHPLVRQRFDQCLSRLNEAPVVVLMVPLLFEANLTAMCSEIWLVDCEEQHQIQRLMRRSNLTEQEAKQRLQAQWPLAKKRQRADHIINNRGSKIDLSRQVESIIKQTRVEQKSID